MSLASFIDYCLPLPIGYLLFVAVAGRLDPLTRPGRSAERASRALGLWIGLAVSSVLIVGLRLTRTTPLEHARELLVPGTLALSVLLVPGVVAWIVHRRALARTPAGGMSAGRRETSSERALGTGAAGAEGTRARTRTRTVDAPATTGNPWTGRPPAGSAGRSPEENPLVATFLDVASPERLDIPDIPVAAADAVAPDVVPRRVHERALLAVEVRSAETLARLERRLHELEGVLARREATLGRVVRALEKEKGRTREEVGALARQFVLHEKQLRARRALEEAVHGVEGRLTTRPSRKIARARPLAPNP